MRNKLPGLIWRIRHAFPLVDDEAVLSAFTRDVSAFSTVLKAEAQGHWKGIEYRDQSLIRIIEAIPGMEVDTVVEERVYNAHAASGELVDHVVGAIPGGFKYEALRIMACALPLLINSAIRFVVIFKIEAFAAVFGLESIFASVRDT